MSTSAGGRAWIKCDAVNIRNSQRRPPRVAQGLRYPQTSVSFATSPYGSCRDASITQRRATPPRRVHHSEKNDDLVTPFRFFFFFFRSLLSFPLRSVMVFRETRRDHWDQLRHVCSAAWHAERPAARKRCWSHDGWSLHAASVNGQSAIAVFPGGEPPSLSEPPSRMILGWRLVSSDPLQRSPATECACRSPSNARLLLECLQVPPSWLANLPGPSLGISNIFIT